jgi:hypothetical protein
MYSNPTSDPLRSRRKAKQKEKNKRWKITKPSHMVCAIFENLQPRPFWLAPLVGEGY